MALKAAPTTLQRRPIAQRLAERGIDLRLILLAPALIFALALFIYPFLYGLQLSFTPEQGGVLSNYGRFFTDPFFRDTIWLTFRLAIPAVLINMLAALPAVLGMRHIARGRQAVTVILLFPLTLGSVLLAKGLLNFLGTSGWVNRTLVTSGVVDQPIQLVHNYWGVLFALIIADFPFVFLLLLSYAAGIDPVYERAAAVFGARPWDRIRLITLPLLAPGLAITASLAFVLGFGVFPSALIVGDPAGSTRTMGVAAYREALQQFDYPMAATIALLMAAIELVVIAAVLVLQGRMAPAAGTGRKG